MDVFLLRLTASKTAGRFDDGTQRQVVVGLLN